MGKPTRDDLERTVTSLREQIKDLRADHRQQINAKNRAIDQARSERNAELATLLTDFPNLRLLLAALNRARELADPLRSRVPSNASVGNRLDEEGHVEDPHISSDGRSTRAGRDTLDDRERVESADRRLADWEKKVRDRIDAWLSDWSGRLQGSMSPREAAEGKPSGPQCWEPDCPSRAYPQLESRTTCMSCGTPFGSYRPSFDMTTHTRRPQCWTHGCSRRGRVHDGVCPECGKG